MSAATTNAVAAGRTSAKTSPCTAPTRATCAASVTYIRVRTTSSSPNPASTSAASMIPKIARAWAAGSPGWVERPSGPASVVPATQHASPAVIARL